MKKYLKAINFDIRSEFFAALLKLKSNSDFDTFPDGLIFNFIGRLHPGLLSDIRDVVLEDGKIELIVRKKGIIGNVPEKVYLHPSLTNDISDAEKAKDYREQTENTIAFFHPFDNVLFQPRVQVAINEILFPANLVDALFEDSDWVCLLRHYVENNTRESELLTCREIEHDYLRIFNLLKMGLLASHKICGNYKRTEHFFEEILMLPISIEECMDTCGVIPADEKFILGNAVLNYETALGEMFIDGIPALTITVREIPLGKIRTFLDDGSALCFIEKVLIKHFIPMDLQSKVEAIPEYHNSFFTLGQKKSYLGISTNL